VSDYDSHVNMSLLILVDWLLHLFAYQLMLSQFCA